MSTSPPGVIDVEKRVQQFIQLRDKIDAKRDALEKDLEPMKRAKDQLAAILLNHLLSTKQTNARTEAGTVHISDKVSATVEDPAAFRQFCVDGGWTLADLRANASRVEEWLEANEGHAVPGVKFSKFRTVGVRRS